MWRTVTTPDPQAGKRRTQARRAGSLRSRLNRLEPQERARRFIGKEIQQTVRSLSHFADSLFELSQQRLPSDRQAALVHHDHLQLFAYERAKEDVALPRRKLVP